jgi:hypothetical protein
MTKGGKPFIMMKTVEFIKKANQVHGDKWDYSKAKYSTAKTPICIICQIHGEFKQSPSKHLSGQGCPICGKERKGRKWLTLEEFISKAKKIHGDKWDYSKVIIRKSTSKIILTCPVHGDFTQIARNHLIGLGCRKCSSTSNGERIRTKAKNIFIARSKKIHSGKYTYEGTKYKSAMNKVSITCPTHGEFKQTPAKHLSGQGCPKCGIDKRGSSIRVGLKKFLSKAHQIHGDKYEYNQLPSSFIVHEKLKICCQIHGVFRQLASSHLLGMGCRKCGFEKSREIRKITTKDFISKAERVHGKIFDYSSVEYTTAKTKVKIFCRKHGLFTQDPDHHLHGQGCLRCANQFSTPHQEIAEYIKLLGIELVTNIRTIIPPKELDIWIPSHRLAIEFNGDYYHSCTNINNTRDKNKHLNKYRMCMKEGIQLLQIAESEWKNPTQQMVWKSIISSRLKVHKKKISARNTKFEKIGINEANEFLTSNHLQGGSKFIRWAFGLKYNGKLVAVVAFSRYQNNRLALVRLAFLHNTTIVGGSSRLLKNSIIHLPKKDIITFSDNRYSKGDIYAILGFEKDKEIPPSYQWYYKNNILNKRKCRHKELPKLLGNKYDPTKTEHENMFNAGARCLYDAGYIRWKKQG